ncbi:hypothetical protein [Actinomadura sp. DC4]|uniref:hypothetical protein n=1 Tax=Actinomadura sp. DC4 TaxID=3055069 RepID=UPI0025AFF63D|nr:hypothetical protein [Actinomadura sp. DC4]MDN3359581.1 hypothetical protein [Actinomadura sp. DC4]
MNFRRTALALAGAMAFASVLGSAAGARAGTDGWRFVRFYKAIAACQTAGQVMVSHRQARGFRCENDYDKAGVPAFDLYVR